MTADPDRGRRREDARGRSERGLDPQFARRSSGFASGAQTMIPSAELEPAPDVPELDELPDVDAAAVLERLAVIRLNGGLATSMGLQQPEVAARGPRRLTFLEIIVGQTLALRRRHGVRLPLILMNSEATREPTLEALAALPGARAARAYRPTSCRAWCRSSMLTSLLPARWPAAPELEWCPPGHGDVYASLVGSGMLDALLEHGFRYVMISNSDNLGATVDPRIAGHLVRERIPFLMEVVLGTAADRKGGHIARRRSDGQLILRETAQTPPEDAGVVPRLPSLALLQHQLAVDRPRRDRRALRRRSAGSICR